MEKEDGSHWTFMGITESAMVPVIAQVLEFKKDGKIKKSHKAIAYDMQELHCKIFRNFDKN